MNDFIYIKYYKRMPLPEMEDFELKDNEEPYHHIVHGSGKWDNAGKFSLLPLVKMINTSFLTEGYLRKEDISFFSINYHFNEANLFFFVIYTKNKEVYICDSNDNNYQHFYNEMLGIKKEREKQPIVKPIDITL